MRATGIILILVFLSSGCISQPDIKPTTNVEVGELYDINPGTIGLKTDLVAEVEILNTWDRDFELTIVEARITPEGESPIFGKYEPRVLDLPEGQSGSVKIEFIGIPIKYQLKEKPLRFEPIIKEYSVLVKYKGKAKVLWVIPISQRGTYEDTITISEIPLDEDLLQSNLNF